MKIKQKPLLYCTIAYIYIPILLFLFGFVKLYFSIPIVALLLFFLFEMISDYKLDFEEKDEIQIDLIMLVIFSLLIVGICIGIGWGSIFPQAGDWHKHNAILHDLCNYRWPVYYTNREHSMLTYYIGQYLVPALFGKLFHSFRLSEVIFCVWGIVGVFLVFFNLLLVVCADRIKKQVITFFCLFFFCGALALAQIVIHCFYPNVAIQAGDYCWVLVRDILLQYRSNLVMLRWVFPQCIVPWLTVILFMKHIKRIEHYVILILPTILFASFSAVSLILYGITVAVCCFLKQKNKKTVLLHCFSLSNVLTLVTFGSVLFFYFIGNVKSEKPEYLQFSLQQYGVRYLPVYLLFCFFMFGIYGLCLLKENRKSMMYLSTMVFLVLIPLFKMGLCNDFVMSTSIPPLFVLMIFVIRYLTKSKKGLEEKECYELGKKRAIILICLLVGCIYPIAELSDNIKGKESGIMSADSYRTLADFSDRTIEGLSDDLKYNYYSYDLEQNLFYSFIAREKITSN